MSPRLLLADDSVTIQRVIELTFAEEDIEVMAVGDGAQAVDQIKSHLPDIVLVDSSMPEKDGYEVAALVKGDPASAHIPVVLLTGAFEPVDESRAETAGCDAVLVKPFEPQQVITKVRELLNTSASAKAATAEPTPPEAAAAPPVAEVAGPAVVQPKRENPHAPAPVAPPPEPVAASPEPVAAPPELVFASPPAVVPEPSFAETVPVAAEPPAAAVEPPAPGSTQAAPPAGQTGGSVLAQAFASFLAVEQGAAPPPVAPPGAQTGEAAVSPGPVITDEMVEDLVGRVVARMTDTIVRDMTADIVSQVAERLVRDEIERIKGGLK